ncbi:lipoprotein [Spiroplasma culicicola]|uniref:Lipoprotein n=1 Tax=Spiroplasma culicicola AES-1 TaxID=1276246 RepID=W6A6B5_9MOLU|nr:lipoprotein [Spiroplasma culicicola]AHI52496.1 hypothetical protein SCULI_v1c01550 [Spiroplasma culicicola AES-1]
MKKLITLLGALAVTASASSTVIACGNPGDTGGNGGGNENLPDKKFELEKTSIDIDTVNPGYINITNYDVLNSNSMPSEFEISDPEALQVTVSSIDKALIIAPLTNETINGIKVTVKSKIHSVTLTVNVKKADKQDQMKLSEKEIIMNTSKEARIKITNFDYLVPEAKPNNEFEFSESNYATAEYDDSNHDIVIKSLSKEISDLKLTIKTNNKKDVTISINIKAEVIDLSQGEYIKNIIAGNMDEYGNIDSSIAVGDKGFQITEKSVLTSFNVMNGVNISADDVVIESEEGSGDNGIGATYYISSNGNSENIIGEIELTLNQGIDPNEYFRNKNLGEIRLFEGAFNKLNEVLNSKDVISLGAMVFEVVGDRNKQLEYVKANFVKNMGAAGQAIMKNAVTTATTFQITNMPDLGGIFVKDQNIEFTFKFVKEDRITFYEGLPENKMINIEPGSSYETDRTPEGQIALKTYVYNSLNSNFKEKITLDHFLRFSKVLYDQQWVKSIDWLGFPTFYEGTYTKIDILPGSPLLYGHDGAAYIGYINNPGGLAGASGGGNLEKYEESGSLDIKYTAGMGAFTTTGSMSGNFYQGHPVINVYDYETSVGTINPIDDIEMYVGDSKTIDISGTNLEYKDIEVISNTNFVTAQIEDKKLKLTSNEVGNGNVTLAVKDKSNNKIDLKINVIAKPIINTELNNFTLTKTEATKTISFEIENLRDSDKITVESSNTKSSTVSEITKNDIMQYQFDVVYVNAPFLNSNSTISIKVNGTEIKSFVVTSSNK